LPPSPLAPPPPAPVAPAPVAAAVAATPIPTTPIASDRKPSIPKKPVDPAIASAFAREDMERATADKSVSARVNLEQAAGEKSASARVNLEQAAGEKSASARIEPGNADSIAPGHLITPAVVASHEPAVVKLFEASSQNDPQPEGAQQPTSRGRGRWMALAAMIAVVVGGGAMFGRMYVVPPAAAEAPGTLVVTTEPAGVSVIVDGQARGVTPLTLELAPGSHELKLAADGAEPRIIPFTVSAGSTVAQSVEFAKAAPTTGQLTIRTDPPGARISIDGIAVGTAPVMIESLSPGQHNVSLANDVTSITQAVTIEAGTTASLVVPMTAPQGVPVSGWISVSAPGEVEIYEDSQLLGTSATERIMVSAGRHELTIVNEAVAYRIVRSVVVTPGKVSPIKIEWPKGSMALNAQPWAEVWVDGERVGETPIGNYSVSIGNHEVIFRHPELGEQVVRATVTATAPARVSVDMRKR
jgi:hypothetical protein